MLEVHRFFQSVGGYVMLTVAGYWVWGFVHHYKEHRLRAEVVVEYLLVGFTVLALFSLVIFQR